MSDVEADLDLARSAARAAGSLVMRWFGTHMHVSYKSAAQPVTEADLAADRLIRDRLCGARPEYGWLSEETVDTPDRLRRRRVWIVDPIDGTRSFIAGRPEFSISIGLADGGRVVAGVVCNPATGELFSAWRGGGAWLQQGDGGVIRIGGGVRRAGVLSTSQDLSEQVPGSVGRARRTLLASRTEMAAGDFVAFTDDWTLEPVGSTAYKLARIAAGRGDLYLSRGPKSEWDVCAGVLLVKEAGGLATDLDGGRFRFNGADPYVQGMLATSDPDLHGEVRKIVQSLPPLHRRGQGNGG